MVTFLRKLFIKDYKNISNEDVRKKHGLLASFLGICFNTILFVSKLIIGIFTNSISIISDALNNMTDFGSSIVNLFGFKMASKKADKEHPYGHERIEYITGMITSFIIIMVGVLLVYNSINTLMSGNSDANFSIWSFIILGSSILLKFILGFLYRGIGKAINSVSIVALMWDSFNDCISTFIVLVASIIQYFFNDLWFLDATMSIIVALFILYTGIKMVKETASPLIGGAPDKDMIENIIHDIKMNPICLDVHDVMVHNYGPTKFFISLHVEVDGYGDIFAIHDAIDNIEKEIGNKYKTQLTIHMDPVDTKSKEIPILHDLIQNTLNNLNKELSFHDLRIVSGPSHTNVIFDVVVPSDVKLEKIQISKSIQDALKSESDKYIPVINFDDSYL